MGGDNFDKSSIGEIIDFYEADRLFREYVESEYDDLIWDIHGLIRLAASNGKSSLMIVRLRGENIEAPVSGLPFVAGQTQPLIPGQRTRMVNGFFFANAMDQTTILGNKRFSFEQINTAHDQLCAYFTKLGYDVVRNSNRNNMRFEINWDRVDRRKFP